MSEDKRPLRLLSLDGGGIRGLSSLYILQHLLVTVQRQNGRGQVLSGDMPSPRACDYFDMIAGTSTGGLIAVMLGVLRMDIQTCIEAYVEMAPEIFPTEGLISGSRFGQLTKLLKGTQRFNPAPLEANIKTLVKKHLGDGATGEEMMRSQPDHGCKVFVCVTSEQPRHHFKFRTYHNPLYVTEDVAIWEACRATSAAPTYFPSISIGKLGQKYLDGGLGYNNPTKVLLNEATQLWPSRNISCIVSIGTGIISPEDVGTTIKPLVRTLQEIATDTEKVAGEVKGDLEQRFPNQDVYFRFNVQHGLGIVDIAEWKEMHRVKTVTEAYLHENHRQIKACADQVSAPNTLISLGPAPRTLKALSTIPFPRDDGFVGREDILAQLESEFANLTSQRWASLYGLGGIGKSQIAIEYSYRQQIHSPQTSTFWVHASSKARFEQSYAKIAAEVKIPETERGTAGMLQLVSKWLSNSVNGPWLLILDNADDATVLLDVPKLEDGTNGTFVQPLLYSFLPQVQHGAVLITSRDRTCALTLAGDYSTPIKVEEMGTSEAVRLLRNRIRDASEEEASELVGELENVPLAISQASAYMREVSNVSIPIYLTKFRRSDKDQAALLNKGKVDLRRDPEVPNAVITSWELSFSQIRKSFSKSADLLSLMSYLNRQAIPRFLLQGENDDLDFLEEINPLLSFCLIRAEFRGKTFEMHRLVQKAMRHWLESEGCDQLWKESAIERVAVQFPFEDQEQQWPLCEILMSHADEVLLYEESWKDMSLRHAELLNSTAWYLSERKGNHSLAEARSTLALQAIKHRFDDDADEVLLALGTLAFAKEGLGQLDEARDLKESIMKHWLDKLGPDHPDTLAAIQNLAISYLHLGLYEKAKNQLKRVVEVKERIFSTEHPEFLISANFLANVQIKMGKYEEAEKQSARVLETSRRCLGIENITTLHALYYLSTALLGQSKFKEAETEILTAIPMFEKALGPGHVMTLNCRTILAESYMNQEGKLNEAEKTCISCLDTAKEVHGLQNQMTMVITNLLALIYRAQGKSEVALGLFESSLESANIVHGPDHPETLTFMFNLASGYYDVGDIDHAIQLMGEVLEKQREVLPANHPNTTSTGDTLAQWMAEEGKIEEPETEKEWMGDACSEEDESEEDKMRKMEARKKLAQKRKAMKTRAKRKEARTLRVTKMKFLVNDWLQLTSLALRSRSKEDHQGSDAA